MNRSYRSGPTRMRELIQAGEPERVVPETGFDHRRHDHRTTEEIRQFYDDAKHRHADDPLLVEMADAGLALLDAELACWEAQTPQQKTDTRLRLTEAMRRMEVVMLAVRQRDGDKTH